MKMTKATGVAAIFSTLVIMQLFAGSAAASLIAYYDFEGPNRYDDKSSNGANGTAGTSIGVDSDSPLGDTLGDSLTNGVSSVIPNNIVAVPKANAPSFGTGDFSITFWLRWDNVADASFTEGLFDSLKGSTTGYQAFVFDSLSPSGKVRIRLDDNTGVAVNVDSSGGAIPSDGTWHHIAFTIDRDNTSGAKVYIDGNIDTSTNPTALIGDINPSQDLWIGGTNSNSNNGGLDGGALDDLAFFSDALTADQVANLYSGQSTPENVLVPEPSTVTLLCLGFLGFMILRGKGIVRR